MSSPIVSDPYDAIEATFRETARGRWFLSEHARRSRGSETDAMLGAIAKLEALMAGPRLAEELGRLRGCLDEMVEAIAGAKAELAQLAPAHQAGNVSLGETFATLDGIVATTEKATSDILDAAEDIQEAAWTLRETGVDIALCDRLDARATEIYAACAFQDLTAQRTERVVRTVRYLEERVRAMRVIWQKLGQDGEAASASASTVLTQSDIDFVIVDPSQDGAAATR